MVAPSTATAQVEVPPPVKPPVARSRSNLAAPDAGAASPTPTGKKRAPAKAKDFEPPLW